MKSIRYIFLIGLSLLSACKLADPQANLLVGTWQETALRSKTDTDWKVIGQGRTATFHRNGSITLSDKNVLSGGWCNAAERYTLKDSRISFQFGEPECIPFVNPNTPSYVTIVSLTTELLVIEWGQYLMKFERL